MALNGPIPAKIEKKQLGLFSAVRGMVLLDKLLTNKMEEKKMIHLFALLELYYQDTVYIHQPQSRQSLQQKLKTTHGEP